MKVTERRNQMRATKQMSESLELGILLALSGGFMDAYSYVCRDQVFANAQTGNMLLFGIHLSEHNWGTALHYLLPVLAFAAGIALAEALRIIFHELSPFHWRQLSVLLEAVILLAVGFIPLTSNPLANSLTSLACGIQVESFRKIRGNGIATTMCIGNLRSGTQHMCDYIHQKKKESLEKGLLYYGIILCFIIGAVIGNFFVDRIHEKAIFVCSVLLGLTFLLMFIDREDME